jgi:8-oxo-dGTP pyrophosphatase MutT (NUDIX family)
MIAALSRLGWRRADMSIADDLERRLRTHAAFDATEQGHLDHLRAFLASDGDPIARENPIGHVTASALVIDRQTDTTLLTHHGKLGKWFQLGGHVDQGDATVLSAALREATEESGLAGLTPWDEAVFDVDVHTIPFHRGRGEPEHLHFDVRFLLAAPNRDIAISDESNDLRWFSLDEAAAVASDDSLGRMIWKVRSRLT